MGIHGLYVYFSWGLSSIALVGHEYLDGFHLSI